MIKPTFCMCFIHMHHFRCTPTTSHSHILKFKVAVAAVPWVSIFNMWLWLSFWGSQNRQKRVEHIIVMRKRSRKVSKLSPTTGVGTPERVGRGYCLLVFQLTVYSLELTCEDSRQGTVTRVYTPLGHKGFGGLIYRGSRVQGFGSISLAGCAGNLSIEV